MWEESATVGDVILQSRSQLTELEKLIYNVEGVSIQSGLSQFTQWVDSIYKVGVVNLQSGSRSTKEESIYKVEGINLQSSSQSTKQESIYKGVNLQSRSLQCRSQFTIWDESTYKVGVFYKVGEVNLQSGSQSTKQVESIYNVNGVNLQCRMTQFINQVESVYQAMNQFTK